MRYGNMRKKFISAKVWMINFSLQIFSELKKIT